MNTSTLTKTRAEAIKKSILRGLEQETEMLSKFIEELKAYEAQIYIGKTDANNEETLTGLRAQIERKNKSVIELNKSLIRIESTIKFRCAHPKAKIPINSEMYTGECGMCHTQIPHKQQIARHAPQLCVPCANKSPFHKL